MLLLYIKMFTSKAYRKKSELKYILILYSKPHIYTANYNPSTVAQCILNTMYSHSMT